LIEDVNLALRRMQRFLDLQVNRFGSRSRAIRATLR